MPMADGRWPMPMSRPTRVQTALAILTENAYAIAWSLSHLDADPWILKARECARYIDSGYARGDRCGGELSLPVDGSAILSPRPEAEATASIPVAALAASNGWAAGEVRT